MIGEESRNQYVRDLEKERDQLRAELALERDACSNIRAELEEEKGRTLKLRTHNALLLAVAQTTEKAAWYLDHLSALQQSVKAAKKGGAL